MSYTSATHCVALMSTEATFIGLVLDKEPNTVRVIHGRTCRIIREGQSPSEGCCSTYTNSIKGCRTCHSVAQLINLLAYDEREWLSWLATHARELDEQGILKMTSFRKAGSTSAFVKALEEWAATPYRPS